MNALCHFTLAGMPSLTLTDTFALRLDVISFFLMGLLLSAALVRWLWNSVAKDFPRLPRLTYKIALAGTVLWGLFFVVGLTMISGARELMTPGAWKKVGWTYQLADVKGTEEPTVAVPEPTQDRLLEERRDRLELIRLSLWSYAATHEGKFPPSREESGLAAELWRQPGLIEAEYIYHPGGELGGEAKPLVAEHQVYEDRKQLVLETSGIIKEAADDGTASLPIRDEQ